MTHINQPPANPARFKPASSRAIACSPSLRRCRAPDYAEWAGAMSVRQAAGAGKRRLASRTARHSSVSGIDLQAQRGRSPHLPCHDPHPARQPPPPPARSPSSCLGLTPTRWPENRAYHEAHQAAVGDSRIMLFVIRLAVRPTTGVWPLGAQPLPIWFWLEMPVSSPQSTTPRSRLTRLAIAG